MAAETGINSVGAGVTPKLGKNKPVGLARPSNHRASGNRVPAGNSSHGNTSKNPARPGGAQGITTKPNSAPKVARPGGNQHSSHVK